MLENCNAFSSFSTNDLNQAETFYKNVLGLRVTREEMGILHIELKGMSVIIYPKKNHIPATHTVLNFEVDNIEEMVAALRVKGINFEQYEHPKTDEHGISRSENRHAVAWFKDPAGNILSVMQTI